MDSSQQNPTSLCPSSSSSSSSSSTSSWSSRANWSLNADHESYLVHLVLQNTIHLQTKGYGYSVWGEIEEQMRRKFPDLRLSRKQMQSKWRSIYKQYKVDAQKLQSNPNFVSRSPWFMHLHPLSKDYHSANSQPQSSQKTHIKLEPRLSRMAEVSGSNRITGLKRKRSEINQRDIRESKRRSILVMSPTPFSLDSVDSDSNAEQRTLVQMFSMLACSVAKTSLMIEKVFTFMNERMGETDDDENTDDEDEDETDSEEEDEAE